tara:strand:+ start:2801 stop:4426 length:1626 start_codon:yes stop_codon:yes gene_type:complete
MIMKYETGLDKCDVNFTPLSPVSLVRRTALAYPDYPAIVFDDMTRTWREVYDRCLKLAGAIRKSGVGKDSTVAVLSRNLPEAVELSYAVPMSGGVLNMINTRLDPADVAYILDHGEAEVFFIDNGLADVAKKALEIAKVKPLIIIISDPSVTGDPALSGEGYEVFLAQGPALADKEIEPEDEWDAVALNYTSGTTARPKGVVYHHRGAYLAALGEALEWSLPAHPRYLWVLPMFHCNGWCFPWAIAAKAGVNICLRAPVADEILHNIQKEKVTHICGAPIVLNMITTYAETKGVSITPRIQFMTAGAAPPAAVLERADALGFDVIHVYGLTEVYGPMAVCAWREEWDELSADERARKRARQGVNYIVADEMSVRNPETMGEMPPDGETMGEIMFRGNIVMKGYLKDPEATRKAFSGGHFHAGDLGVRHPDGHVEIKDRSKDIIISGGENISSIEVESVIYKHSAVSEAAVVAGYHETWGETPVAFVELKEGVDLSADELIVFCRDHLAHFKCPTRVIFDELPKTSTGKIQKFELRNRISGD